MISVARQSCTCGSKILRDCSADPLRMYLADIFTSGANLARICGISLPCGFAQTPEGNALPLGLQFLGQSLGELPILQLAHAYEQSTGWHKERPAAASLNSLQHFLRETLAPGDFVSRLRRRLPIARRGGAR